MMRAKPTSKRRLLLTGLLAAVAVLGLTSCDGEADHYYVFFGTGTSGVPGCATWCVKSNVASTSGDLEVHISQKVRFVNFAAAATTVKLTYKLGGSVVKTKQFVLAKGASKKVKITSDNVPDETVIVVLYSVAGDPPHGGPNMIVRP
jgi:hypothetical protein